MLYFVQRFLGLVKFLRRGKSEMSGLIYLADAHQVILPLLFYAVELIRLSSSASIIKMRTKMHVTPMIVARMFFALNDFSSLRKLNGVCMMPS